MTQKSQLKIKTVLALQMTTCVTLQKLHHLFEQLFSHLRNGMNIVSRSERLLLPSGWGQSFGGRLPSSFLSFATWKQRDLGLVPQPLGAPASSSLNEG